MIRIGLVIDTWTWVEYYETNNPEISAYIDGDEDLYVSSITLTEILRSLILRVGEDEADACVEDILYRSRPVPVSYEISINPYNDAIESFQKYLKDYPNSMRIDEIQTYLVSLYLTTKNYKEIGRAHV